MRVALGLGANLGSRSEIEDRFRHALDAFGASGGRSGADVRSPTELRMELRMETLRVASLYRTRALSKTGAPLDQPDFLNTVAVGELPASSRPGRTARRLLARCKRLESDAGRELAPAGGDDREDRPRPLDLDLLLLGDHELDLPPRDDLPAELWPGAVQVPHPRLTERRFVLRPLAELVPELRLPGDGRSVARALEDLEAAEGGSGTQRVDRLG